MTRICAIHVQQVMGIKESKSVSETFEDEGSGIVTLVSPENQENADPVLLQLHELVHVSVFKGLVNFVLRCKLVYALVTADIRSTVSLATTVQGGAILEQSVGVRWRELLKPATAGTSFVVEHESCSWQI